MRVSELEGAHLNYWVAKAEGLADGYIHDGHFFCRQPQLLGLPNYDPSTNWAQGGPIIDREIIQLVPVRPSGKLWHGIITQGVGEPCDLSDVRSFRGKGETPLIAAMRAYVASKFGEEVSHPKEGA